MPAATRVVIAHPDPGGDGRGATVLARALRDAGFEVILAGSHQSAEQIVDAAIQEDADLIGIVGTPLALVAGVRDLLAVDATTDITVFAADVTPEGDADLLARMGVARTFTARTPARDIVSWVEDHIPVR